VSNTIAGIDDSSSHVLSAVNITAAGANNLRVEGKCSLHADIKTGNVESLKHDFSNLFSIFWRIHGWLSQNESVFLRLAPEITVDAPVPELFHGLPVLDNTLAQELSLFVMLGVLDERFITNEEVELGVIVLASPLHEPSSAWLTNSGGYH